MSAIPKLQPNHRYIDRAIEQWLDIHFGDQSFNGRVILGCRKHGGGIRTITAKSLSELRPYVLMMHTSRRMDYYITANTVSGVDRKANGLFGLHNIVIDVDCHNEKQLSEIPAMLQSFLWRCDRDLWDDLPRPNSIVRTGRGVQLWWAIKPCHASCRYYYDQIKTGLIDRIEELLEEYGELADLKVDRASSINAVGYFRVPCTYNTNARRYGSLQVLHSERYDTHDLAGYIRPLPSHKRAQKSAKTVPLQSCDLIVLHNAHSTGANRVMQLVKLRNLRNNEVGAETRNDLCFAVYNSLRMSFDHDEAMERLRAYNSGFKQPMSEKELEHTICSAKRKGGYKYSNEKLIELLEITPEEQDTIGLHPFTGSYKPWSHARPNATRDAVRKARRDGRDAKIVQMYQDGVSQAETARQLGLSRNTVSRVIQDWIAQRDLEIARENLLKNGSIYDCVIEPQEGAVSTSDGQPSGAGFAAPIVGSYGGG